MKKDKQYYETVADEKEFLDWYKAKNWDTYEKPSMAIDNVILGYDREVKKLKLLLVKRKANPFRGKYALPGGFVNPDESAKEAAIRETYEETGVSITDNNQMWQIGAFTEPNRDPRQWIISVAHVTFLGELLDTTAGDDAESSEWFSIDRDEESNLIFRDNLGNSITLNDLAFDHADIIETTFSRIKENLEINLDVLKVLGATFTAEEALGVLGVFDTKFNTYITSNFMKVYLKTKGLVVDTNEYFRGDFGRPKKLLRLS